MLATVLFTDIVDSTGRAAALGDQKWRALLDALRSGHLGGAGVDVWWEEPADPADPLLALPNLILTPHIAADTVESEHRLAALTAENVRRVARGEKPRYVVGVDVDAGK